MSSVSFNGFNIAAGEAQATGVQNALKSNAQNSGGATGATTYPNIAAFKQENPVLYHAMEKSIMTNIIGQLDDRRRHLIEVLKKARKGG